MFSIVPIFFTYYHGGREVFLHHTRTWAQRRPHSLSRPLAASLYLPLTVGTVDIAKYAACVVASRPYSSIAHLQVCNPYFVWDHANQRLAVHVHGRHA